MKKRRAAPSSADDAKDFRALTDAPNIAAATVRRVNMNVALYDQINQVKARVENPPSLKEWVHERGYSSSHAMPAILRPGNLVELYPMLQCDPEYVAKNQPRVDVKFETVDVIVTGPSIDAQASVPLL